MYTDHLLQELRKLSVTARAEIFPLSTTFKPRLGATQPPMQCALRLLLQA